MNVISKCVSSQLQEWESRDGGARRMSGCNVRTNLLLEIKKRLGSTALDVHLCTWVNEVLH